jgi:hypothetical protein
MTDEKDADNQSASGESKMAPSQFPFKVDIGIKVEAKTELPAASAARTVDALTDAIRPWTEALGWIGDAIRLKREDVLLKIAVKARARAEIENLKISPPPPKFMLPYLENASVEDIDSELIGMWTNLLVNAGTQYTASYPMFVQIMKNMTPDAARILNDVTVTGGLYLPDDYYFLRRFIETLQGTDGQDIWAVLDRLTGEYGADGGLYVEFRSQETVETMIGKALDRMAANCGALFVRMYTYREGTDGRELKPWNALSNNDPLSVAILSREGLIALREGAVAIGKDNGTSGALHYANLTSLCLAFLKAVQT